MNNQDAPAAKQSKGIKKLWIKLKASMKSDQAKSSQKSTALKASTPTTSNTSAPVVAKTVTEPTPQQAPESSSASAQPIAQPESKKVMEDTTPVSEPMMPSEAIQVDDDDQDFDEKIQIPQMRTISTDKEATAMRYQMLRMSSRNTILSWNQLNGNKPTIPVYRELKRRPGCVFDTPVTNASKRSVVKGSAPTVHT